MKKTLVKRLPFILLVITLGLGYYNHVSSEFWKASAVQLLTPLIAICITFLATQFKNDQQKAKEHVEAVLVKIQQMVSDDRFCSFSDTLDVAEKTAVKNQVQITNRKISNCIEILMKYSNQFKFKDDAEYIKREFERYRETVDTYLEDFDYLEKSVPLLKKYAANIDSKCDQIILKLFS